MVEDLGDVHVRHVHVERPLERGANAAVHSHGR